VIAEASVTGLLDYPRLERTTVADREEAARAAHGELLAVLGGDSRPAGNWITTSVPYFGDTGVGAVVVPMVSPPGTGFRERVASAVLESRLGGGSRRSRFLPGNVGTVPDYPADAIVVRRTDYLDALDADVQDDDLVAWLAERGRATIYTPDASASAVPPRVVMPHLRATMRQARARGSMARISRGSSLSAATALSVLPLVAAVIAVGLFFVGGIPKTIGVAVLAAYGIALTLTAALAALRLRSFTVGLLTPLVIVLTQAAYVLGFARGLVDSARVPRSVTPDSRSTRNLEA
jgi:hypothetical protein